MSIYSHTVRGRTGVHPNIKCSRCRITAAESSKREPAETGINHPEFHLTHSFYRSAEHSTSARIRYLCPRCHRENAIKELFALMDARDAKKKED